MVKIGNIDRFIFAKTQRGCFTSTHYVGRIFSTVCYYAQGTQCETTMSINNLRYGYNYDGEFLSCRFLLGMTCCSR